MPSNTTIHIFPIGKIFSRTHCLSITTLISLVHHPSSTQLFLASWSISSPFYFLSPPPPACTSSFQLSTTQHRPPGRTKHAGNHIGSLKGFCSEENFCTSPGLYARVSQGLLHFWSSFASHKHLSSVLSLPDLDNEVSCAETTALIATTCPGF